VDHFLFLSHKKKKNISVKKCFRFIGLRAVDRRKNLKRKDFFTRIRFQRGYEVFEADVEHASFRLTVPISASRRNSTQNGANFILFRMSWLRRDIGWEGLTAFAWEWSVMGGTRGLIMEGSLSESHPPYGASSDVGMRSQDCASLFLG
jgi:hypothetical protein